MRKPRTIMDDASEFLTSAFMGPISLFGGPQRPHSKPEEVFNGTIELNDEDIVEGERGEEGEVDDSGELMREVKIIAVDDNEKTPSRNTIKRRTWVVYPLRKSNARTGGL